MITIKNNDIHLTRGDSAYLMLEIHNNQGVPYKVRKGDKITITIRDFNDSLVLSKTTDADTCIAFEPKDTDTAKKGRYKYDIQLTTVDGEVFTVVPKSNFYLEEDVTHE